MLRLAITVGEPAGIGPDLALSLIDESDTCEWVLLCDPALLEARAKQLGKTVRLRAFELNAPHAKIAGELCVKTHTLAEEVTPGTLSSKNSSYVLNTLLDASELALSGHVDAVVTGPVHKGIINDAGVLFTGHTEFFLKQSGVDEVIMMLMTEGLRVSLVTTHCPLKEVPSKIKQTLLLSHFKKMSQFLTTFYGIEKPRLLVAGLNPHAGENGHLGSEELEEIIPAIQIAQGLGLNVSGPYPADTLFTSKYLAKADCIVAMYHDQGLPVLKHMGFGAAVNVTVGLPFIRTSVDHGVALDLAGSGNASVSSLLVAIKEAKEMASRQRQASIRK